MKINSDMLDKVLEKYFILEKDLMSPDVISDQKRFTEISKEFYNMSPLIEQINRYKAINEDIKANEEMIAELEEDSSEVDYETIADLKKDILFSTDELEKVVDAIKLLLLPQDQDNLKNVVMEIRPCTGGDEAALFVADLSRMYSQYAQSKGWSTEILSESLGSIGGYKEIIIGIRGKNVFEHLRFESGVHRVQRVPVTETSGRIHTSTSSVAVLPEVEEVDIKIDQKDLRIDFYRSSGPGGQSVNTTDSAVRITHLPSNIVVTQQDEKSQHKNKAKAMKILCARLYDKEREEMRSSRTKLLKSQVGTGERCERIRTYNFPQNRVTDHRVNISLHNLPQVISEGQIQPILDELLTQHKVKLLAEFEKDI